MLLITGISSLLNSRLWSLRPMALGSCSQSVTWPGYYFFIYSVEARYLAFKPVGLGPVWIAATVVVNLTGSLEVLMTKSWREELFP